MFNISCCKSMNLTCFGRSDISCAACCDAEGKKYSMHSMLQNQGIVLPQFELMMHQSQFFQRDIKIEPICHFILLIIERLLSTNELMLIDILHFACSLIMCDAGVFKMMLTVSDTLNKVLRNLQSLAGVAPELFVVRDMEGQNAFLRG